MNIPYPKNMDKRPKRRKDKNNPYEIFSVGINTDDPHYYVSFVNCQKMQICIEIEKSIFDFNTYLHFLAVYK